MVLGDLAKDERTLVEKLLDNSVFGRFLEVLKSMLYDIPSMLETVGTRIHVVAYLDDKRSCLVARQRRPLALQGLVHTANSNTS